MGISVTRTAAAPRSGTALRIQAVRRAATSYALMLALGGVSVLPLLWMLSTSLKDTQTLFVFPPEFVPAHPTLLNYAQLFQRTRVLRFFLNSAIVSCFATLVVVFLGALAGYGFAKMQFPGRDVIFFGMLSGLMIPFEILIIPLFIIIVRLGWANTYQGIILPMAAGPLGIFVMRQFLLSIPNELLDAARIDGSSEFGIFWRIVLPISKPALASLSALIFLSAWNAFLWPLISTTKEDMRVLPLAIALLQLEFTGVYGMMMAMATLTFTPPLIIFLLFQRYFVQGITLSGLKG